MIDYNLVYRYTEIIFLKSAQLMIKRVRRKVFVIPYVEQLDSMVMVQDRMSKEWGFISGGVKKNESYFAAAQRELSEETSGLMNYIPTNIQPMDFVTWYRPTTLLQTDHERGETVQSVYKVFWIPIHVKFIQFLCNSFRPNSEIVSITVEPYWKQTNRWVLCDAYMEHLQREYQSHIQANVEDSQSLSPINMVRCLQAK
jgi:8-oxo-dGTP pyrophosphatase MutT (NUDIX family)